MTILTKFTSHKFLLPVLIALSLATPKYLHAKESKIVAPLHIKIMSGHKKTKSPIKIRLGKLPIKNTKTTTKGGAKEKLLRSTKARTINVSDILSSISCLKKTTAQPKNRSFILAESIRLYLSSNNHPTEIIDAIYNASQETGVDFEMLVIISMIESSLGRNNVSATSSAQGAFQFTEPTWLALMKKHGKRIGYKEHDEALIISKKTKGRKIIVHNQKSREETLDLRHNNYISSLIKSYQIIDENKVISSFKNGQKPNITDHYITHMLGVPLARIFYKLYNSKSDIIPANLKAATFREAVSLNKSFFYDKNGVALNANKSYKQFKRKITEKFKFLYHIDTKYGSGLNISSSPCSGNLPKITTVSSEALATNNSTPPTYKKPHSNNTDAIIKQIRSYSKTKKIPVIKQ